MCHLLRHSFKATGSKVSSPVVETVRAPFWCKFSWEVNWWSSSSTVFTDLFIATKGTVYFCVFTRGKCVGFAVETEDDDGKLEEGPILGAVVGW